SPAEPRYPFVTHPPRAIGYYPGSPARPTPPEGSPMRRSIFLVVLVVLLTWPAALHAGEAGKRMVQTIKQLGGKVDSDDPEGVATVVLYHTRATDADLRDLAALKNLKVLLLDNTAVTDEGLKPLASLKQLHTLTLSRTRVTGTAFKDLAGLQKLQFLRL